MCPLSPTARTLRARLASQGRAPPRERCSRFLTQTRRIPPLQVTYARSKLPRCLAGRPVRGLSPSPRRRHVLAPDPPWSPRGRQGHAGRPAAPAPGRMPSLHRRRLPRRGLPRPLPPRPAMTAALGFMRRGELVPDSTVWDMVRERSGCLHCQGGFILDGFPRTLPQAESLKQFMDSERLALDAVLNYELPIAEVVERLTGRRTCENCKAVYHVSRQPSRTEGVCDRCQ